MLIDRFWLLDHTEMLEKFPVEQIYTKPLSLTILNFCFIIDCFSMFSSVLNYLPLSEIIQTKFSFRKWYFKKKKKLVLDLNLQWSKPPFFVEGGRVIMACRDMDKARNAREKIIKETGNYNVIVKPLDLASFYSIREFASDILKTEPRLDTLINNAGVMMTPQWRTEDGHEMQFGTNHLGHFLLTNLLLDKLKSSAPSRVVTVSSNASKRGLKTIQFNDLNMEKNYAPFQAYCHSKLANVIFSAELARRLEGTGVTTYSLHPGVIETELLRHQTILSNTVVKMLLKPITWLFLKPVKMGAQTTIMCAVEPSLEKESGKYYLECQESKHVLDITRDRDVAKRLWEVSEKLTGLADSD